MRLGAALGARSEAKSPHAQPSPDDTSEAVAAVNDRQSGGPPAENGGRSPPLPDGAETESTNVWNDEAAESAFRAEARDRGEPAIAPRPAVERAEETVPKNLPPLDELVKRLPPEVRETLDDLFRVKFTTVRRVPKAALKA